MTMRSRGSRAVFAVLLVGWGALLLPRPAIAMSRDVRSVIRIGEYGILGGTLLGLAAYPTSGKLKTIFLGSSVGLYVGLAIGVIYAIESDQPAPWQESQSENPERRSMGFSARDAARVPPAFVEFRAPVYRF